MDGRRSRLQEPALDDLPIFDPKPLHDLLNLGGSAEVIQELIALFQEDVPLHLALLKTAMGAVDGPKIMMEAHQLKGALGNLGLARFADLAARIEALALEGHLEQVPRLADTLTAAYEEALQALNAAFPGT
jgi:HPt (histidine-containing phosphotransfer) domain-containing protein